MKDEADRKRAEEVLEQERNLYRDLVASQPSGVYRLRIRAQKPWVESEWVGRVESNYKMELVSDLFCELLGATREQCEANAAIVVERIHPEDRPGFVARNVHALETLEPFTWEGRLQVKDRVTWVCFASVPRCLDDGDVIWTGILLDITERKWVEAELQKSRLITENSPTGLYLYHLEDLSDDRTLRMVYANPAVKTLTGVGPEDVVGRTLDENFPGLRAQGLPQRYAEVVRTQTILTFEDIIYGDGRVFQATFSVKAFPLPGNHVGVAFDNITERKNLENERREFETRLHQTQRLESLGVLAGGIAHDFNNILMVIMGHADLVLDELSPLSPARGGLAEIVHASKRAADLCAQMLTYAGRKPFERRSMSLRDLIEETLHMLRTCISKKALLSLNLDKALPCMLGDPSQIRQVLMNLVINASDAIGERSGAITISTGAMDCSEQYLVAGYIVAPAKPGIYVYIEVSDTGCGMDKKTVERIFEPFFTTKFTGRGLGLSAIMGIVATHEGALKVYSEPGKGSRFKVLFPAIDVAEEIESEAGVSEWHGSGTVLLVDDEETIRAISSKQLRRFGLEVLTAENGRQAVDIYRERRAEIALVLLDLTMPQMNGEEAFRELRQINPDVSVILASGYCESDITARFVGKGLAGCLQKPYTMAKLRSLLSTLLPKSEPS